MIGRQPSHPAFMPGSTVRIDARTWLSAMVCLLLILAAASPAAGQGSIFGEVTNSNATTPADGEISFFGYLDDTDEEIRIESSTGAGYDSGNWYDDFQNYLTESPGNPYDYHFYNFANGEGAILSKLIPNNSYQQEDITLGPVTWPPAPQSLSGQAVSSTSVVISWTGNASLTYHVYRRTAPSLGSFFRIDDPSGLLTNPGVADSFYVDTTADGISSYDYLVIAEDASGNLSAHSLTTAVNSSEIVAPTIAGIIPNSGRTTGGTPITIFGSGFDMAGATATIGGNPVESLVVLSPFEIAAYSPAGSAGPADVLVTNSASALASAPLVDGFTYFENVAPTVTGIPDQTIPEGNVFTGVDLDGYVSDPDHNDSLISWTYSGTVDLIVTIDGNRVASVSPPNNDWFGSESIIFRATDPGGLFDEDTAVYTVTPVNDSPVVSGIPDQAIIGGGAYASIDLDGHVEDIDNTDAEMTWSYSGAVDLGVSIIDRVATITSPGPDWVGSETIVFRATDPGLAYGEDSARFVHVAVDMAQSNYQAVLVGHPDSLSFEITTPAGFSLESPQIVASDSTLVVRRADGGDIGNTIPAATTVIFWAVWTPVDTSSAPGTINISSVSVSNSGILVLDGLPVDVDIVPPFAGHDFGDVNAVDIRAAETLFVTVDVGGTTPAAVIGTAITGSPADFTVLAPAVGDTLVPDSSLSCIILSHPGAPNLRSGDFWIHYSADLTGGTFNDSLKILDLTATGVEPACAIVENTVDFGERKIGETHSQTITIGNSSTVPEVIDSLSFDSYQNIFAVDPGPGYPLFLPPGDTTITILFSPLEIRFYSARLVVTDSLASGDCDPPIVQGIGITDYVHWQADQAINFGLVKLCDTSNAFGYRIANRTDGFDLVLDSLFIDSAGWFSIEPDPGSFSGIVYSPSDTIILDRIGFHPRDLLNATPFRLTLLYHVDTVGAPADSLTVALVSAAGGCAGQEAFPADIAFGSIDMGAVSRDTALLINSGNCNLVIDSIQFLGVDFAPVGFVTPTVIGAGGTARLVVQFQPSDLGLRQGSVIIYHDGYFTGFDPEFDCPLSNQSEILFSGFGIDTSPPSISSVSSTGCGQTVTMQISDVGSGIDSVFVTWREGNARGGYKPSSNQPLHLSGDLWQFVISDVDMNGDSINIYGYEIQVIARDREGLTDTLVASISGCLPQDDGGALISGSLWLGENGEDTLWHLVSFPGSLPSYRVDSIFVYLSGMVPSIGDQADKWRLYEYRGQNFEPLTTNVAANTVEPGRGYWLRHIYALDTLRLAAPDLAMTWPTDVPLEIRLEYGWNLISSPYLFPVYIEENLLDTDSVSSFVRQFQPALPGGRDWWEMIDVGATLPPLQPWHGYAVRCENPSGYSLYLDPHFEPIPDSASLRDLWNASITLSAGPEVIGRVEISTFKDARDYPDLYDVRPIELFARKPGLILRHPDHGEFIRDVRPVQNLSVWNLEIDPAQVESAPVRLSWIVQRPPDQGMIPVLRDCVADTVINMVLCAEYAVENPRQMPPGRFVVYYGEQEALEEAIGNEIVIRPDIYTLYQNYPNPFNPSTTIAFDLPAAGYVSLEIFDVTGQKVRSLVNEYFEAGSYQRLWDGCDRDGHRLASGIYFYRLEAGGYTETKKLLLLK